jgi:hypothetical protein
MDVILLFYIIFSEILAIVFGICCSNNINPSKCGLLLLKFEKDNKDSKIFKLQYEPKED